MRSPSRRFQCCPSLISLLFYSAERCLFVGTGEFYVNGIRYVDYFPELEHRWAVCAPFFYTGTLMDFDMIAVVRGGGHSGQSGAIKHAAAKALQNYNRKKYRPILKKSQHTARTHTHLRTARRDTRRARSPGLRIALPCVRLLDVHLLPFATWRLRDPCVHCCVRCMGSSSLPLLSLCSLPLLRVPVVPRCACCGATEVRSIRSTKEVHVRQALNAHDKHRPTPTSSPSSLLAVAFAPPSRSSLSPAHAALLPGGDFAFASPYKFLANVIASAR